jgi:hypothetical protein
LKFCVAGNVFSHRSVGGAAGRAGLALLDSVDKQIMLREFNGVLGNDRERMMKISCVRPADDSFGNAVCSKPNHFPALKQGVEFK